MIAYSEENVVAEVMPLAIVWRNPLNVVQAGLRIKEANDPFYGWAEQGRRIRAFRAEAHAKNS